MRRKAYLALLSLAGAFCLMAAPAAAGGWGNSAGSEWSAPFNGAGVDREQSHELRSRGADRIRRHENDGWRPDTNIGTYVAPDGVGHIGSSNSNTAIGSIVNNDVEVTTSDGSNADVSVTGDADNGADADVAATTQHAENGNTTGDVNSD